MGGSSVAFSYDSRLLAEGSSFHPVNMGHDIELSLSFMLSQTGAHLRPGDVVVVAPEYPLLWGPSVDHSLITVLEHDPRSLSYVDPRTGQRLCDRGLNWIAGKLRCALYQVETEVVLGYRRTSFDEVGDFVEHRGKPSLGQEPLPLSSPNAGVDLSDAVEKLDAFGRRCEDLGVTCLFTYAPLRRSHYEQAPQAVAELHRRLRESLRIPVVGEPVDAVYPDEDFYDAGWHLTDEAARRHTLKLRERLGPYVEERERK